VGRYWEYEDHEKLGEEKPKEGGEGDGMVDGITAILAA